MSKTTDYFDNEWNIRPHASHIINYNSYSAGTVLTEWGIIEVYSEIGHSRVMIVLDGRCHSRMWHCRFTPQTLVTLAKRFAKEKSNANIS